MSKTNNQTLAITDADATWMDEQYGLIRESKATRKVGDNIIPIEAGDVYNSRTRFCEVFFGYSGAALTDKELKKANKDWKRYRKIHAVIVSTKIAGADVKRVGNARIRYKNGMPMTAIQSVTYGRDLTVAEQREELQKKLDSLS